MIISPEQCRAARAWLDWKQEDLATAAGVSLSTVRDFEKQRRSPIANNARALASALENAGLRLIFASNGSPKGIERTDS
nr:helix-turn-helix transcriptional regulator [Bosea sp. CRIB-10]